MAEPNWNEAFEEAVRTIAVRTALTHEQALKALRVELLATPQATLEDLARAKKRVMANSGERRRRP